MVLALLCYSPTFADSPDNSANGSASTNNNSKLETSQSNQPLSYEDIAPAQKNTLTYEQSKKDLAEAAVQDKEIVKLTAEGVKNAPPPEPKPHDNDWYSLLWGLAYFVLLMSFIISVIARFII